MTQLPRKRIVLTGSTRGIGFGLAEAFLARGCDVMISGRKSEIVLEASTRLAERHGSERVAGHACDVQNYSHVEQLWEAAMQRLGGVDIWINNAGVATTPTPIWELHPEQMQEVTDTNVLGTLYGTSVALRGMMHQGFGALYNMEGFGSHGNRVQPGLTVYGMSKAALAFLDRSLPAELKGKPIITGSIMPGMVVTDMLYNQKKQGNPEEWERTKRIFNILADRVEVVAPWLADRILANKRNGAHISYMNGAKLMWRFISAPVIKRNVID